MSSFVYKIPNVLSQPLMLSVFRLTALVQIIHFLYKFHFNYFATRLYYTLMESLDCNILGQNISAGCKFCFCNRVSRKRGSDSMKYGLVSFSPVSI